MTRIPSFLRRLTQLHGQPVGIAGGFTLGLALSLVPIPVVGMLVAIALAPLLRCNLPATYLGSAVVNPVTGALFYFSELWVGLWLLGRPLPAWHDVHNLSLDGWQSLVASMVGPFAIGALALMLVSAVLAFPTLWWLARRWQARRRGLNSEDAVNATRSSASPTRSSS